MLDRLGTFRKDIQWINGLIFVNFFMVALLIGGASRLMAPEVVKPMLVTLYKSGLLETNSIKNFQQTKKSISALPPSSGFKLQDIPAVGITAGAAAKLDTSGFVAKVSSDVAFRIYEGGTTAFNPQDQALIGPLANITRANYKKLTDFSSGFWAVTFLFGLIMFIFGKRYGRVFSLGFAVMISTFIPMMIYQAAISAISQPSTDPKAVASMAMFTALKPAVQEGQQYVLKFFNLSLVTMFAALMGRVAYALTAKARNARETDDAENKSGMSHGVHQTRLLELKMPYDKAFDLCMASLGQVEATVKQEDRALGKLTAKTWRGFSKFIKPSSPWIEVLFGIGETIKFELFKIDEENTRIQLASDPSVITVKFDWGQNLKNIEKISEFLEAK